jgi:hypothetical protein
MTNFTKIALAAALTILPVAAHATPPCNQYSGLMLAEIFNHQVSPFGTNNVIHVTGAQDTLTAVAHDPRMVDRCQFRVIAEVLSTEDGSILRGPRHATVEVFAGSDLTPHFQVRW